MLSDLMHQDPDSLPIAINFESGVVFGILRGWVNKERIVILCPATTGTRIGPQRIYVEIAHELQKQGIASLCVDLPPLGDSFDNQPEIYQGLPSEKLYLHYSKFIKIIMNELFQRYNGFDEIILLSISDGCLPVYRFARANEIIDRVILLSPNHLLDEIKKVNSKNFKQYFSKLFKKHTWVKLFLFQLNFSKIFKNIFPKKGLSFSLPSESIIKNGISIGDVLTIFGENEPSLSQCLSFWGKEKNNIGDYSTQIVPGADHSFFGWQFKRDVITYIINWLNIR